MTFATIFYAKNPHPSEDENWGSIYRKIHYERLSSIEVPKAFGYLKRYWTQMPIKEKIDTKKIIPALDKIFEKYNVYSTNPYSSDNDPGQMTIKKLGVQHTSMSVGDMVKVGKKYYVVAGTGFTEMVFV